MVEDDVEMLLFIRKQLKEEYTVFTAQDGEEGLEILKRQEVDLIITDLMMPGIDGISFCKLVNSDFSINDLAIEMGISSSGLFSKIKKISSVTPNKLIQSMRLKKAAELLGEGKYRVNEVCYIVGFNNPSYFSKCFHRQFGRLPKDYGAEGEEQI